MLIDLSQENIFFDLAKHKQHPRTRIRLLALGHIQAGKKRKEIANMFQVTTESLRLWVKAYSEKGLDGLQEGFRSGRKKILPTELEESFRQEVERLQEELPGGRIRATDIQELLHKKFGADFAHSSVYRVLERCRLSWITARSKHIKSSPEIQEDFKKNSQKKC